MIVCLRVCVFVARDRSFVHSFVRSFVGACELACFFVCLIACLFASLLASLLACLVCLCVCVRCAAVCKLPRCLETHNSSCTVPTSQSPDSVVVCSCTPAGGV